MDCKKCKYKIAYDTASKELPKEKKETFYPKAVRPIKGREHNRLLDEVTPIFMKQQEEITIMKKALKTYTPEMIDELEDLRKKCKKQQERIEELKKKSVQEFIDAHHNPIVRQKNKEIKEQQEIIQRINVERLQNILFIDDKNKPNSWKKLTAKEALAITKDLLEEK